MEFSDAELDDILERFMQTKPDIQRGIVVALLRRILTLEIALVEAQDKHAEVLGGGP